MSIKNYYIKTERTFTVIRKYGFIFTLAIAFLGLWIPLMGLLVIPVIIGLTLYAFFKGRFWCGNICAHGSLYDSVLIKISRNTQIPKFFRSQFFGVLFFLFFMFMMIKRFIIVIGLYGSLVFFERMGLIFVLSYLMVTLVGGTLGVVFMPRTWCQFCPMGMLQKISYGLGKKLGVTKATDEKVTLAHDSMCHKCGKCSRVCPMQLEPYLNFSDLNQLDDAACIRCLTCVENCPAEILTLSNEKAAAIMKKNMDTNGFNERKKIKAQIVNIESLSEDIQEYSFKFLTPLKVDYESGQFMLVKIQDVPETFRAFSISSTAHDPSLVKIIIKNIRNGYGSEIIFNHFKVGDIIDLEGPMGRDLIVDPLAKKVLLIGIGIGITPFIPMVKDLIEKSTCKEIKLLFGTKFSHEHIYHEEFEAIERKSNKRFEFRPVVSREPNWNGRKGHVTDHLQDMKLQGYKVYMCGSHNAIHSVSEQLIRMGVKPEDIQYESA